MLYFLDVAIFLLAPLLLAYCIVFYRLYRAVAKTGLASQLAACKRLAAWRILLLELELFFATVYTSILQGDKAFAERAIAQIKSSSRDYHVYFAISLEILSLGMDGNWKKARDKCGVLRKGGGDEDTVKQVTEITAAVETKDLERLKTVKIFSGIVDDVPDIAVARQRHLLIGAVGAIALCAFRLVDRFYLTNM